VDVSSGKEAVASMREHPETAVILLDVVMESSTAGLDACRAIREELGNHTVRILLRTGQPGVAPEKKTIEDFDIDGYLPKAELTSTRLWSAVRTALKAWTELTELERHRATLQRLHESVIQLCSYEPVEQILGRLLDAVVSLVEGCELAVLDLDTFDEKGEPLHFFHHKSPRLDPKEAEARAVKASAQLRADPEKLSKATQRPEVRQVEGALMAPIVLHRELGYGWIFAAAPRQSETVLQALPLLAAHARNALYATLAQRMLEQREGPFYDSLNV